MKILHLKSLRGPNYWSNYRQRLIVVEIDLAEFEEKPSNSIPNFNQSLKVLLPSLKAHCCSYQEKGGFFKRLEEGTWLGHVIEHVALELQWLSGMPCGFGRTRSTSKRGIYYVIFEYEIERAGIKAAYHAFDLVKALAYERPFNQLATMISELKAIYAEEKFGPSTQAIITEIKKRNIPFDQVDNSSLLIVGQGVEVKYIQATETGETSIISAEIAGNKALTKNILRDNHIAVPKGFIIKTEEELQNMIEHFKNPIVIKPLNANHGKGVTCHINEISKALVAFKLAKNFSTEVIVEEYIPGKDFRLLVIDYRFVAAAKREPAKVVGDGESTIEMLINYANQHPARGVGHANFLTHIVIDDELLRILKEKNLNLSSILPRDFTLSLKHVANISSGGTAEDVTDLLHPENIFLAERIARLIHLDVCGIDVVTEDIREPIKIGNGAVIEVNSAPGLRMHLQPTRGKARNVATHLVDMLYPPGNSGRIPLIAVTGTNGKTTVVRIIAAFAKNAGYTVGFTTTEGITLNGHEVFHGDCSGPQSAKVVLRDPLINFAVLECARGGILREGLAFDQCNISIVTNITEDHLGIEDILTLNDLARVKSVVPRSTQKDGFAILNADDQLVYDIRLDLECQIALFSMSFNDKIKSHVANGGIAIYIGAAQIILANGSKSLSIAPLNQIPFILQGKAVVMIKNLLPAIMAAYLSHFSIETIRKTLLSLKVTPQNFPGRMNIFHYQTLTILLDYAHNKDAFLHLKEYVSTLKAQRKIGIIAATGDRREIDINNIGELAAEMFDEIIIRHDKDSRGRSNQQLTDWLLAGINSTPKSTRVKIISDEFTALQYAINHGLPHSFIFYFPDNTKNGLHFIQKLLTEKTRTSEVIL